MSRPAAIRPEFVEYVPKQLDEGVLYISIPFSTTVHKCGCGCGSKITLPINAAKWRFLWDGSSISLWPSVGNWSYPCKSHYWIEQNCIEWAPAWSKERIEANRARDQSARARYLESRRGGAEPVKIESRSRGLIDRVRGMFRR